jgi:hypothetical protein
LEKEDQDKADDDEDDDEDEDDEDDENDENNDDARQYQESTPNLLEEPYSIIVIMNASAPPQQHIQYQKPKSTINLLEERRRINTSSLMRGRHVVAPSQQNIQYKNPQPTIWKNTDTLMHHH